MKHFGNVMSSGGAAETLAQDRVLQKACAECGTAIEARIPAGTLEKLAEQMARFALVCEDCIAKAERAEDAERRRMLRRKHIDRCLMPGRLRGLGWDSYDVSRRGARSALAASQAWARQEGEKPGLMIVGPTGVGKTRLAATAAWEALSLFGVRWVSVTELMIKAGAAFTDKARSEAVEILTTSDALVLDDLDKVQPSTWALNNLYLAIDKRYSRGMPLFVTTNLDDEQLRAKLTGVGAGSEERAVIADAIVSRLVEHCVIRGIDGDDQRLR